MDLLDAVTYPRPLADLLEAAYDIYRQGHPWVADYQLAPKSVARDMYERAMTFAEYVGFYGLARSEGLVLRYLADAYKALRQTVPEEARTEELTDLIEWLGELVRQVDSSLIDEWERLRNPREPRRPARPTSGRRAVTGNPRAFRVLVRNALFRRVELAALRRYDELGELDADAGWDARGVGRRARALLRRARRDRHRLRRARPCPADHRGAAGPAGWPGRSSMTRPVITTGASARPSTWPRRTRPESAVLDRDQRRPAVSSVPGQGREPPLVSAFPDTPCRRHDLHPERHQRDRDQLEVRQAERDADDRDAQRDAGHQMSERQPPAEQHDPDDVADQRRRPGIASAARRVRRTATARNRRSGTPRMPNGIVMIRMNADQPDGRVGDRHPEAADSTSQITFRITRMPCSSRARWRPRSPAWA